MKWTTYIIKKLKIYELICKLILYLYTYKQTIHTHIQLKTHTYGLV